MREEITLVDYAFWWADIADLDEDTKALIVRLGRALEVAENQVQEVSVLVWDYDEWEALRTDEPAVAIHKLHKIIPLTND